MQCTSCGTTLPPGVTTCPSCGAQVSGDTYDPSPYETNTETVPYISYAPAEHTSGKSAQAETKPPAADTSASPAADIRPISSTAPSVATIEPQPLPASYAPQQSRRFSATEAVLFTALALLLVIGGGGIAYYAAVVHPGELNAQATAVVQNILTSQAQATANVDNVTPQQLYSQITSSKPTYSDPLNDDHTTLWLTPSQISNYPCSITNGAYHAVITTKNVAFVCLDEITSVPDLAFQVQMTILKGDQGGLAFRSTLDLTSSQIQSYCFGLDANGGYHLLTLPGGRPVQDGTTQAARTGLNQPNLLTVIARSNRFYLYVNRQFIAVVNDNTFTNGGIGLFVLDNQNPTEVAFSNAQVWAL